MNKLIFFLFFAFTSCSTFSKYSPYNKVESCVDGYYCIVNDSLQLKYESLGGFHYANNLKEYRKMKIKNKPKFKIRCLLCTTLYSFAELSTIFLATLDYMLLNILHTNMVITYFFSIYYFD